MARIIAPQDDVINVAGATPDNNGLTTATFIATGATIAAPTAVVLGSLKTTFVVGGVAASVCAYGAHRVSKGETAFPIFEKKDEKKKDKPEAKSDEQKEDDKSDD